mmetsp:Transcript_60678/g.198604  ORF Transcript_60678/g.198604 Transcript_60678/m.198604 type:complete len:117 (-) Transcript_60678:157-507(-)
MHLSKHLQALRDLSMCASAAPSSARESRRSETMASGGLGRRGTVVPSRAGKVPAATTHAGSENGIILPPVLGFGPAATNAEVNFNFPFEIDTQDGASRREANDPVVRLTLAEIRAG